MIAIDTLLSGFIGAIVAIMYQRHRDKKEKEYFLAKDRLEKIYGPLLLIFDANKDIGASDEERFQYNEEKEEKFIDELLLHNYAFIEEDRTSILLSLYGHKKFSESVPEKEIIDAIKDGYNENLTIISQKNAFIKIKDYIQKSLKIKT